MNAKSINFETVLYAGGGLIAAVIAYKIFVTAKPVAKAVSEVVETVANGLNSVSDTIGSVFTPTITPSEMTTRIVKSTMPSVSPGNIREQALTELNARRTAAAIENTNVFTALPSLFNDFKDWYQADTFGKDVRDNFYARNPDGVFYD